MGTWYSCPEGLGQEQGLRSCAERGGQLKTETKSWVEVTSRLHQEKLPEEEDEWLPLARPLSDELWRPTSWSCRGGSVVVGVVVVMVGRFPWLMESFSRLCSGAPAPPARPTLSDWPGTGPLQSERLVSEVSEEPDRLRSSPPPDGQ